MRHIVDKSKAERFRQLANTAGIKLTPQRMEIYRIVSDSVSHPNAEEIYKRMRRKMPSVSPDTVYRTLRMLADLGLIQVVGQPQDSVRYDANSLQHHHFTCIKCGFIGDFSSEELNALEIPREALALGKSISFQVVVKGICENCLRQTNDPTLTRSRNKGVKHA